MPLNNNEIILEIHIADIRLVCTLDCAFREKCPAVQKNVMMNFHTHPNHEIFVGLQGVHEICFIDRAPFLLKKDAVCMIPPGIHHLTRRHAEYPDAEKLAIRFFVTKESPDSENAESLYAQFEKLAQNYKKPILYENKDFMRVCLEKLRRELNSHEIGADLYAHLLLKEFFLEFIRMVLCEDEGQKSLPRDTASDECNSRYVRIEDYIHEHCQEPITEQDLADVLNLSKRQLERILQTTYGRNFREILVDVRIHNAAYLLQTTTQTVEEIAFSVGYESLSGFYSAFKKKFGVSAAIYRKKFRES